MNPLLKWPGGKRLLAEQILGEIGTVTGSYYEPFCGGGAVFFRLQPTQAIIADVNPELTNCYEQVKQKPREVAAVLDSFKNSERAYYSIRDWKPRKGIERAARLIYLVSLSFNGIYRQNLKGDFNVPYGFKVNHRLPTKEQLIHFSEILQSTCIRTGDFEHTTGDAGSSDVIYFDPPYTVAHNNNGFVKYNARIFSWDDQHRLSRHAHKLRKRGCRVLVSNACHPSLDELYKDFNKHVIVRRSVIAAASDKRTEVAESLYVS